MSLKDLPTTIAWTYVEITLWVILCFVVSILLAVEFKTLYTIRYGEKIASQLSNQDSGKRKSSDIESNSGSPRAPADASATDITCRSDTDSNQRSVNEERNKSSANQVPIDINWRLQSLPLFMYLSYLASGISAILFKLGIAGFSECTPCGVQGSFYTIGKMILYCIFLYRLHVIYSKSVFRYSTKCLTAMGVTCVVFMSLIAIVNFATVTSVSVDIDGRTFCGCIVVMALAGLVLLFDAAVSIMCCCFFIKPIKTLQMLEKGSRDEETYG
eukprot:172380_1